MTDEVLQTDTMGAMNSSTPDNGAPDVLIVPDSKTNRDLPSAAAGLLAAHWRIPVIDFNTLPENKAKRLVFAFTRLGIVGPSRSIDEVERIAYLLGQRTNIILATANGPIDIQCCYPLMKSRYHFKYEAPFDDDLPFAEYCFFDTFDLISNKWQQGEWFYPIMTTLGCPFSCTYCACRRRKQQYRSIQHCIDELKIAKERWDIQRFVVIDDCFNADLDRAKRFANAVSFLELEWMAGNGLRADRFDVELGMLMRRSGCKWVSFGVESTDGDLLISIKKGESFEQIDRAVTEANHIFDYVNVFLILGLPGSSYESDRQSIAWAKSKKVGVHVSFYVPFDKERDVLHIFDRLEGRDLPQAYDKTLQVQLYHWAKK